jgi:hypothetical protein
LNLYEFWKLMQFELETEFQIEKEHWAKYGTRPACKRSVQPGGESGRFGWVVCTLDRALAAECAKAKAQTGP